MKYLYKFLCKGQDGKLEGLFVSTEKEINDMIGQEIYFRNVLGRICEVSLILDEKMIVKLDVSTEDVEKVTESLGDTWSGYNPLKQIKHYCDRCGSNYIIADNHLRYVEKFEKLLCEFCENKLKKSNSID